MTSERARSAGAPARLRYSKVANNCLRFVIVDIFPDGRADFWAQEPGEVRWFAFAPSPDEREAALDKWRTGGCGESGWPLLIP